MRDNKQRFLLTFFSGTGYEEKEVNDYWLVKMWNGNSKSWQVAIYNKVAYSSYKKFQEGTKNQYQQDLEMIRNLK